MSQQAVLAVMNNDVYQLNNIIKVNNKSEPFTYKSSDTVGKATEASNYAAEFFNSLHLPGMPPYVLELKFGVLFYVLGNIYQTKHYNETHIDVKNN